MPYSIGVLKGFVTVSYTHLDVYKRQAPAHSYGRYENVFLTDTELSELRAELPEKWAYYIERLSGYFASTGKKYKNHAATIHRWAADNTAKAAPKQGILDYTCKEGESL